MKLSDTQLVILSAACQREDRKVLPLPSSLKGGAVTKVIGSLLAKALIEEVPAPQGSFYPMHEHSVWREVENGERLTLVVTDAAFAALGLTLESNKVPFRDPATEGLHAAAIDDGALVSGTPADQGTIAAMAEARARKAQEPQRVRPASKQSRLIDMLRRPEGVSIEEIMSATGWQSHTVRGAISGALKKKFGLKVISEKVGGRGRVYKLPID